MTPDRSAIVYLDWNVLRRVVDGERAGLERVLVAGRDQGRFVVPFAREHVLEATRGITDDSSPELVAKVERTLRSVSAFTRDTYLCVDLKTRALTVTGWSPFDVYEWAVRPTGDTRTGDPISDPALAQAAALAHAKMREALVAFQVHGSDVSDILERFDALGGKGVDEVATTGLALLFEAIGRSTLKLEGTGFAAREINGVAPEDAFDEVDRRMKAAGGKGMTEIEEFCRENIAWWDRSPASSVGLLLGYRRDPASASVAGQMSDIAHLDMGLQCSVFVTDDRRLRDRAHALVARKALGTRVWSCEEAERGLREWPPPADDDP